MNPQETSEQQFKEQAEITSKEIRGVTAKVVVWFFGGFIIMLISFVWGYAGIFYQLKANMEKTVEMRVKIELNSERIDRGDARDQIMDIRVSRMEESLKDKVFYNNVK
jgi:hypothetical protein